MIDSISATTTLNNGTKMPWLGLGTWQSPAGQVESAIKWALEIGYRHIDTASIYGNEEPVGRAIRESGIKRGDIFLTTKVWNEDQRQGTAAVAKAFEQSLERLGTDYVDLYLVHWPVKGRYKETWQVVESIYQTKRARAIGVSNFLIHHLKDLLAVAKVVPAVNQLEFHPLLRQQSLLDFCVQNKIQHEAWSPLMQGKASKVQALCEIGKRHGKSPEQVTLRWELQKGSVVIPKSVRRERLAANAAIFDFSLDEKDMAKIDALDQGKRFGSDPDTFKF